MAINFPLFERLEVLNYQLYPGRGGAHGLVVEFDQGPWVVLGVNGLGKTTLLLIMKRLLAGPVNVRDAGFSGSGSEILSADRRVFATRVGDQARGATAEVRVRFGAVVVSVKRRLDNLELISSTFNRNGAQTQAADEEAFRIELADAIGLARFGDVLRILDRIVFFLESREGLLWNTAAQFEIFRALLLPQHSGKIRALESEIVSADSSARNLNAALFKLSERRRKEIAKHTNAAETSALLEDAKAKLASLQKREEKLFAGVPELDQRREDARRQWMQAARKVDDVAQQYEEVKYNLLRHAFAGVPPSDKYVFLKLITERICATCGSKSEDAAKELERRTAEGRCLICGTPREIEGKVTTTTGLVQEKVELSYSELEAARERQRLANEQFAEEAEAFDACQAKLATIRDEIDRAKREIRRLQNRLPADARSEEARYDDRIEDLRRDVVAFRREREEAETSIAELLCELSAAAVKIRVELEGIFKRRAEAFFSESVRLVYDPRKARIGQTGRTFEFPAFEVELTSGSTAGEYVRRVATDVSLSQREYLDLIFRMSLVEAIGGGTGTFVVDGPEGSVDAVFAKRAGDLFSDVAAEGRTISVILACNVVAGDLIPHTLQEFPTQAARESRVIDLTKLATPTAALTRLRAEYDQAVGDILGRDVR